MWGYDVIKKLLGSISVAIFCQEVTATTAETAVQFFTNMALHFEEILDVKKNFPIIPGILTS
jgi:hypothetical protein